MDEIPILAESEAIFAARKNWVYRGTKRPDFAEPTAPGEESVWDFPRPPRIEGCTQRLTVTVGSKVIAETDRGVRVVETSGAPTYYFPTEDVDETQVHFGEITSVCEWKGSAQSLAVNGVDGAGWRYVQMFPAFRDLYLWPSFHPSRVDCFVGDEQAKPQPGGFYGGWMLANLKGPIKGVAGSQGW